MSDLHLQRYQLEREITALKAQLRRPPSVKTTLEDIGTILKDVVIGILVSLMMAGFLLLWSRLLAGITLTIMWALALPIHVYGEWSNHRAHKQSYPAAQKRLPVAEAALKELLRQVREAVPARQAQLTWEMQMAKLNQDVERALRAERVRQVRQAFFDKLANRRQPQTSDAPLRRAERASRKRAAEPTSLPQRTQHQTTAESEQRCATCRGTGRRKGCRRCNWTGRLSCVICHGTRRLGDGSQCPNCASNWSDLCIACHGGTSTCPDCAGAGRKATAAKPARVSRTPERRYYVNHCWRCKRAVNSGQDATCSDCGWLVCSGCYACGCR